ncbi:MAG: class I SAM-dependent methyltransferase [Filomicrobium sp.]
MPLQTPQTYDLIETTGFADYELLDSGSGRKLERFGDVTVNRPEPQALWQPRLSPEYWQKAHAVFSASGEDEEKGKWRFDRKVPESWPVKIVANHIAPVTMLCRLQGLWHLGLFPEQLPHWQWMLERIEAAQAAGVERPRVLNLFGYTGAASLLAAAAGAEVVHVDASKKAIQWARENQSASGLEDAPIRWMLDDARKFLAREVRRGRDYHVLLVDPPKFGRGPKNETWDLFTDLPALIDDCAAVANDRNAAIVLTVYAIRASGLAFAELVAEKMTGAGGDMQVGELSIRSRNGKAMVPTSLFVRWAKD